MVTKALSITKTRKLEGKKIRLETREKADNLLKMFITRLFLCSALSKLLLIYANLSLFHTNFLIHKFMVGGDREKTKEKEVFFISRLNFRDSYRV